MSYNFSVLIKMLDFCTLPCSKTRIIEYGAHINRGVEHPGKECAFLFQWALKNKMIVRSREAGGIRYIKNPKLIL